MPVSDSNKRNLRLPRELAGRLKAEAQRQGISENDYLILAARQQLDLDQARRKQLGSERQERRRDREAPRGLGLRPLRPAEPAPLPAPPDAPAPVVVNVGGAAAALGDGSLLEALATYILTGPAFSREQRRRMALEVIRAHGKTPAEREALTEKLDQVLAVETEKPARPSLGSSIGSLFR